MPQRVWVCDMARAKGRPTRSAPPKSHKTTNPPYGEKGDFRRLSVTLSPGIHAMLVRESARRRIAGERDYLHSCIIREALASYLKP